MTPERRSPSDHRAVRNRTTSSSSGSTTNEPTAVVPSVCACGVAADGGRKAVAVDPDIKARNRTRLRRIEGQVRGLQKMVDEDRYCADIMTQIASVHEALRSVGRALMRNHLQHCASSAIRSNAEDAERMYDELVDLMYTSAR